MEIDDVNTLITARLAELTLPEWFNARVTTGGDNGAAIKVAKADEPDGDPLDVVNVTGTYVDVGYTLLCQRIPPHVGIAMFLTGLSSLPTFTTVMSDEASIPGFVILQGQAVPDGAQYARLKARYPTVLPDWRGRSPMGAGSDAPLATNRGSLTHAIAAADLPNLALTVTDPQHAHGDGSATNIVPDAAANGLAGAHQEPGPFASGPAVTQLKPTGISVSLPGGGVPLSLLHPVRGTNFFIRI